MRDRPAKLVVEECTSIMTVAGVQVLEEWNDRLEAWGRGEATPLGQRGRADMVAAIWSVMEAARRFPSETFQD
jgi:hypothetical protein